MEINKKQFLLFVFVFGFVFLVGIAFGLWLNINLCDACAISLEECSNRNKDILINSSMVGLW